MMDLQYVESAKYIRSEFLSLNKELSAHEEDLRKLSDFLFKKIDELKDYRDTVISKMKTREDLTTITAHLMKEIVSIEDEEKRINSKVDKLNVKLEKLKESEKNLFSSIRDRYPDMSDDQIRKEIQSHLEK